MKCDVYKKSYESEIFSSNFTIYFNNKNIPEIEETKLRIKFKNSMQSVFRRRY